MLLLSALGSGCATQSNPEPRATPAPIVGAWQYAVPGTVCTETYDFHSNGFRSFVSGEERGKSRYEIRPDPEKSGAFLLEDTITETNGATDCSGSPGAPAGDKVTLHIRFNSQADRMIMCLDSEGQQCIGPFLKTNGT
jgi:hypothetical protein